MTKTEFQTGLCDVLGLVLRTAEQDRQPHQPIPVVSDELTDVCVITHRPARSIEGPSLIKTRQVTDEVPSRIGFSRTPADETFSLRPRDYDFASPIEGRSSVVVQAVS